MRILEFVGVDETTWNAVADRSPQAWLFHRSEWIGLEARYSSCKNLSFAVVDHGRVVAIHPLYLSDVTGGTGGEVLLHSGIHRHAALALDPGLSNDLVKATHSVAMRHIDQLSQTNDVDRVQLGIQNLAPQSLGGDRVGVPFWVTDYGFFLGMNYVRCGIVPAPGMSILAADQIVDLQRETSRIFSGFDPACRRAIRKAEANAFTSEVAELDVEVDIYYALAEISAQRTGEALPPLAYYLEAARKLGSKVVKLFLVKHDAAAAAALIILSYKGALSFLAGVSHPDYLGFRVNDFIHWSAMQWGAENHHHSYRLGPYFPEVPVDWDIAKRSKFKSKFGARDFPVIQASFFRRPERYLQPGIEAFKALVDGMGSRLSFFDG